MCRSSPQTCARTILLLRAIVPVVLFLVSVSGASFASGKTSPLYSRTLGQALRDMRGSAEKGGVVAAAQADVPHVLVTTAPGASTICESGTGRTVVCTQTGTPSTTCAANSRTACAADPACIPTTRPQGTQTMCRGDHTFCRNGNPVVCTAGPGGPPTTCPVSQTWCSKNDPNCYTFIPGGGTTLCPGPNGGAQTACQQNQPVYCTRDPMSTTQCAHSSRTACPTDPACHPAGGPSPGLFHAPVPFGYLEPASGAQGSTVSVMLAFTGDLEDFIAGDGTMTASFGPGVTVMSTTILSPVEAFFDIFILAAAPLGPRLVTLTAGDVLGGGESVVHVGTFTVLSQTGVIPGGARNFLALASQNPHRSGHARLSFGLAKAERATIAIYDVRGRLVRKLTDRDYSAGSNHSVEWDRRDASGRQADAGIYFAQLRTASYTSRVKLTLMRE